MPFRRAVCVVLAAVACTRGGGTADIPPNVAIVYSADVRGAVAAPPNGAGGLARRATVVDRIRLIAPSLVQVDAGDIAPSIDDEPELREPESRRARVRLALQAYERMGVDAVTIGERDLALGVEELRALCTETKASIVSANVVGSDGRPLFAAEKVVHAGALAVGVFGILDRGGETSTLPPGVSVTDPVPAARAAVGALRAQGARIIVGLFHVAGGLARARAIASAASGVDLIVLGHHGGEPAAAPFFSADARGRSVGRVDIRVSGRGTLHLEDHKLSTTTDVPEQTGVRLLVRVASGPVARTFAESVAALSKAAGRRTYGEEWTYGSTPLCAGCHVEQAAQWKTTEHARAFATHEQKGNDRDPACMGCHMTGFLSPGGSQNFETATTQFADVGCEACHGPSVAHITSFNKHQGTTRTVDPVVCLGCHTPDRSLGTFSVTAAMKEIVGPGHGLPSSTPP